MLLFRSPTFVLEQDILRRLFRLVRTDVAFQSEEDVDAAYAEVVEKLRPFPRASAALLVDMRQGPRGAAPGSPIERAIARNAVPLHGGWARVAILLATPVGVLQATRVGRSMDANLRVFNDESAALAYLLATE